MSGAIHGASASWRRRAPTTAIRRGILMLAVVCQTWRHRAWLGVALALLGVLTSGCARSPASDPAMAELLRQIREAYLFDVDVSGLELLSVPEIVARLDPDTRMVEMRRMSLDFIRGLEPEGAVVA